MSTTPAAAPLAPLPGPFNPDAVLDHFLGAMSQRGLTLFPEQEEAILELLAGHNVILNTPTGSGKSLVASALHFKSLCAGERSVYTCPIKALVNEKFLALCRDYGPENVGMMTGDASVNPQAPVLCCTAEILANIALHRGDRSDIRAVVMDEFHYYSDSERGYAWQVPLLTMPQTRFLLMSATLGSTEFFEKELTRITGAPTVTVRGDRRPVPLSFEYSETPLTEKIAELIQMRRAPIYLVYFTQRSASDAAQALMSLNVCTKEEKAALQEALLGAKFNSPYGKEMKRWLRHGIGVHHAGLLPKYRVLVEQLAQKGLLKLICGTDTLGVGINVPIRTVLFTQLWKYDGTKAAILSVRDFRQVAGRAGRKGFDDTGYVVVQAPEHVIENKRAEEKAAADPRKKKVVKQRAPEGAVSWDFRTYERLLAAPPEGLVSRFEISHGMLLLMLSRETDGCRAMRQMIADCHETPHKKKALRHRAWQLFRALLERKIVEFLPKPEWHGRLARDGSPPSLPGAPLDGVPAADGSSFRPALRPALRPAQGPERSRGAQGPEQSRGTQVPEPVEGESRPCQDADLAAVGTPLRGVRNEPSARSDTRKLRVNVDLQEDFSLHQALSLYLIDTLPLLDRESPDYPFDVLTLCEAIVEDPEQILRRQVDKLKTEKLAELKAADVPYEERMEKLDEVEHPKPRREFLYDTFNAWAAAHPWVGEENIRPKSIAREMYERYLSFADYIRDYGLERSEGLLLRHLSQTWKVLSQTVPDTAKTEPVIEMETYFRELIRGIDSSLLEEWERLRDPSFVAAEAADKPERPATFDVTRDRAGFRRLVRTALLGFLQDVAGGDWENAAERVAGGEGEPRRIEDAFMRYFDARARFRLDPEGRSTKHTHWDATPDTGEWEIAQVLVDPAEQNDWEARFAVSLERSRAESRVVLRFAGVNEIGQ